MPVKNAMAGGERPCPGKPGPYHFGHPKSPVFFVGYDFSQTVARSRDAVVTVLVSLALKTRFTVREIKRHLQAMSLSHCGSSLMAMPRFMMTTAPSGAPGPVRMRGNPVFGDISGKRRVASDRPGEVRSFLRGFNRRTEGSLRARAELEPNPFRLDATRGTEATPLPPGWQRKRPLTMNWHSKRLAERVCLATATARAAGANAEALQAARFLRPANPGHGPQRHDKIDQGHERLVGEGLEAWMRLRAVGPVKLPFPNQAKNPGESVEPVPRLSHVPLGIAHHGNVETAGCYLSHKFQLSFK